MLGRMQTNWISCVLLVGMENGTTSLENGLAGS